MIESFGFYEAVHEDDREQHVKFTANLGRSFVAACIEQGRFQLGPNLQPIRAVELSLGHSPLSTQNVNYLKLDVRPISQVPDVVLRDLHKDKPRGPWIHPVPPDHQTVVSIFLCFRRLTKRIFMESPSSSRVATRRCTSWGVSASRASFISALLRTTLSGPPQ